MIVLAIDTSTLQAGVALWRDGQRRSPSGERLVTTHSEALLAMIDEAFVEAGWRRADVDAVACGAGPGSFTGLRIGLATAKGLCFALGKPLVMISSLAALAARAPDGRVLRHARRLQGRGLRRRSSTSPAACPSLDGAEAVLPPAQLVAAASTDVAAVVGIGARKYPRARRRRRRLLDERAGPAPGRRGAARRFARAAAGDYDDACERGAALHPPVRSRAGQAKRAQ